jgi:GAF domain-containing protein
MSDDAALHILRERRGKMYDPLIVDTFSRVYREIAPAALADGPSRLALNEITSGTQHSVIQRGSAAADVISMRPNERGHSHVRSSVFEQRVGMDESDIVAGIRGIIRFSLGVLFLNDDATNELEATYVFGHSSEFVRGLRIPLGQRLSGWVAVNRQTIMNSDASLDLGDLAQASGLRVCLSTPLVSKDHILGVITLYSTAVDGFKEADRSAIELFAQRTIARKQRHDRLPA